MEYIFGYVVFILEGNVKVGDVVYSSKYILIAIGGRLIVLVFLGVIKNFF